MKIRQARWSRLPQDTDAAELMAISPQLAWVFGDARLLSQPECLPALQAALPGVTLVGCSTAGEISHQGVDDHGLVVTALHLDQPDFIWATTDLQDMGDSRAAGQRLAQALSGREVRHVMVFGQGVNINGSALIAGMQATLGPQVPMSGGLAGDGGAFKQTWTVSSQAVSPTQIVALGLCGENLRLRYANNHGWRPFGVARRVTRCEGNILYELDGEPALSVYRRYLGEYAKDLPGSGLLFPFEMLAKDLHEVGLIRTILGIDEQQGSLILAGDIEPEGYLKLMHASTNSLVDGAQIAAESVGAQGLPDGDALALLVSCVGRKLVMGSRVDEEVEAVAKALGQDATVAGYYSYGEISPWQDGVDCKLHNQTMTVTYLYEAQ